MLAWALFHLAAIDGGVTRRAHTLAKDTGAFALFAPVHAATELTPVAPGAGLAVAFAESALPSAAARIVLAKADRSFTAGTGPVIEARAATESAKAAGLRGGAAAVETTRLVEHSLLARVAFEARKTGAPSFAADASSPAPILTLKLYIAVLPCVASIAKALVIATQAMFAGSTRAIMECAAFSAVPRAAEAALGSRIAETSPTTFFVPVSCGTVLLFRTVRPGAVEVADALACWHTHAMTTAAPRALVLTPRPRKSTLARTAARHTLPSIAAVRRAAWH